MSRKNMTREKSPSDPQRSVLDRDRSLDEPASGLTDHEKCTRKL